MKKEKEKRVHGRIPFSNLKKNFFLSFTKKTKFRIVMKKKLL